MKRNRVDRRRGGALALALVAVVIAGLLGAALIRMGSAAAVENAKQVTWAQAFWSAEAGLAQARTIAEKRRRAGIREIFPLIEDRSWTGSTARGRYAVTVEDLLGAPPSYRVVAEGTSAGGARAAVEAVLSQVNALSAGLFGANRLDLQPNQTIISDPPGQARIGSNGEIDLANNMVIGGTVLIGADTNGQPAACATNSYPAYTYEQTGWVDPDPLGALSGALSLQFAAAALNNNNGTVPQIHGNVLRLNQHQSATLSRGTYYLETLDLAGELVATNGPVTIFLTGAATISGQRSAIITSGNPSDFRIYSNSAEPIKLWPGGDFHGMIYAPLATIDVKPNNLVEGLVWGNEVQLQPQNNARIVLDSSLLDYTTFTNLYRVSATWRQLPRSW